MMSGGIVDGRWLSGQQAVAIICPCHRWSLLRLVISEQSPVGLMGVGQRAWVGGSRCHGRILHESSEIRN